MLSVEDWAAIRRLHVAERMPIRQIARKLGISKNTVKVKLAADAPPSRRSTAGGDRIGWSRGMTVLNARVRELRPVYLPPDPSSRTLYVAGEIAQNDFWVPGYRVAGRVRADPHRDRAAGVDDGQRVLADAVRPVAAGPHRAGSVRRYRVGDYWTIPARIFGDISRTNTRTPVPPDGVQHHYAPLAWINSDGGSPPVTDLRKQFTPLATGRPQQP